MVKKGCRVFPILLFLLVSGVKAQFVNRPVINRYLNFAKEEYREMPWVGKETYEVLKYDSFGEYLMRGYFCFLWDEVRSQPPFPGSIIFKDHHYMDFYRLIIGRESYKGFSSRITLGDALETTFTPLTLNLAIFTGMRWDAVYRNHRFTMIWTRPSNPMFVKPAGTTGPDRSYVPQYYGLLLLGGHWEGRFLRDHLRIGTTLINMHRFDSLRRRGDFWRGVSLPDAVPDTVIVCFSDDSPEDGIAGAAVFEIRAKVKVDLGEGKRKTITDIAPVIVLLNGARRVGTHWEANGEGVVEFHFPMPENAVGVDFTALVGNDYRISLTQVHKFVKPAGMVVETKRPPAYVIRRAEGNIRDMSNKRWVSFSYGMSTAMNLWGFNFDLHLIGFKLRGEVVWNRNYFQYPVSPGGVRTTMNDMAYYLLGEKRFGPFTLGGEVFSIGPKYNSYHPYSLGFYFNEVVSAPDQGYRIIDPLSDKPPEGKGAHPYDDKNTLRYAFVDDNDDHDRFSDLSGRDSPQRGRGTQSLEAGVYPGLDKDQDGVPDNNRNNNHIPDYLEPFLKYEADPDDFYWGDDTNNNSVVDVYEDDLLPNYPYYKDERGWHLFLTFTPFPGLDLTYGYYDIHQVAGGGINRVGYWNLDYYKEFPGLAEIEFHHQLKRVHDDIKNLVYRYQVKPLPGLREYESFPIEDELTMRNSLVNRGLLEVNFWPLRNLRFNSKVRYELNSQKESFFRDGTYQKKDRIDFWGVVTKMDYRYRYKKLVIMPKFKYFYFKKQRNTWAGPLAEYTSWYPILRMDYELTKRTSFQLGIEGLPFLKERYEDRLNRENTFSSTTYVLQMSNRSVSWGHEIFTNVGYEYTSIDYDDPGVKDTRFSRFFIRVVVGEKIIGEAQ